MRIRSTPTLNGAPKFIICQVGEWIYPGDVYSEGGAGSPVCIVAPLFAGNVFTPQPPSHYSNIINKYSTIPWTSFMVWGFPDSPISWNKYEHGYDTNGENDYACVFHQDAGWILYQAVGSFDTAA